MEDLDELLEQLDDDPDGPQQAGPPPAPAVPPVEVLPATEPPVIDVREQVQRAGAISDEILASWRSDRCEAQDAANFIKDILDNIIANGDRPSATLIEQYVKALEVKANTNQTAVKCVDGITKLLAATKPGTQVQNNTVQLGNKQDLIAALSRSVEAGDP